MIETPEAHTTAGAATPVEGRSPLLQILGLPAYRYFLAAQVLGALVSGTMRFNFVWLATDLTSWQPAVGLVALGLGLPALLLSVPAGVLTDRIDRRRLVILFSLLATGALVVTAALTGAGAMNVPVAMIMAFVVGSLLAAMAPAYMALVPILVPEERLMNGVALQNIAMMVAQAFGAVIGGAAIALFGTAGGFVILGALQAGAALFMRLVRLPPRAPTPPGRRSAWREMLAGLRFSWSAQPLPGLLLIGGIVGFAGGVATILVPEVSRNAFGRGPFDTSLLFAALGTGMVASSLAIASTRSLARPGLVLAIGLSAVGGPGLVVMGASTGYWVTFGAMLGWGLGGGLVMTTQRALLQRATPSEMMGRVMGVASLAMAGALPIAAVVASAGASAFGSAGTLVASGVAVFLAALGAWRRDMREL